MDLIVNAGTVMILIYGGWLVIQGEITLGALVAFMTYLAQLAPPVRRLGRVIPAIAQASAAGQRIFAILDADPEVRPPDAIELPPLRGHVRFENVSLGLWRPATRRAGINFKAKPGQVIALLGRHRRGQVHAHLSIPRFYDPTGPRDASTATTCGRSRAPRCGGRSASCSRRPSLFAASIRENIAFGRPDASEAEIVAAAQAAQAHEFILETARTATRPWSASAA